MASDGTAYFGNDGGMYSRPAGLRAVVRWNDLNATLRTLQYYYAGIGRLGRVAVTRSGAVCRTTGPVLLNPGAAPDGLADGR